MACCLSLLVSAVGLPRVSGNQHMTIPDTIASVPIVTKGTAAWKLFKPLATYNQNNIYILVAHDVEGRMLSAFPLIYLLL